MESRADQVRAFVFALLLHAGLFALIWFSADWIWPSSDANAAGEPIRASLVVSAADIKRAQKAIRQAPAPTTRKPPQPKPAPRPETSDIPIQPKPQKQQPLPDTVDRQRLNPHAQQPPDKPVAEREHQRQDQVDLTEDIARQQEAERKQRLREQLAAIQAEREKAAKRTRMEEQRLAQLTDLANTPPKAAPDPAPPAPDAGNRGQDEGLLARYKAALLQAADSGWNRTGAPPRVRCNVRFTQIPGGEVIDVQFLDCPFDAQGRDSVDRALRRNPMPYAGFESVFIRNPTISFCYPLDDKECQP